MNPGALPRDPPFSVVWFRYALGGAVILGGYLFVFFSLVSCLAFSGVCPSSDDMKRTHPPVDDAYGFLFVIMVSLYYSLFPLH